MQFLSSYIVNNLLSFFHMLPSYLSFSTVLFPRLGFELEMYLVASHPLLLLVALEKRSFLCFSLGNWPHD